MRRSPSASGLALLLIPPILFWVCWGFIPMCIILVIEGVVIMLAKPRYSWETNFGLVLAFAFNIVLAVLAVNDQWHEPVLTGIAIAAAIILFVI